MQSRPLRVLKINSSARINNSLSRQLVNVIVEKLKGASDDMVIIERVLQDVPFVTEPMTEAMFMDEKQRNDEQAKAVRISDLLVEELKSVDIVVVGVPIYNFNIPASLKAYIDQVTRSGLTFQFTKDGPVGLIREVKAYIVFTSEGTRLNSAEDFASGYMKFILGFIGIKDVTFVNATGMREKKNDMAEYGSYIESLLKNQKEAA